MVNDFRYIIKRIIIGVGIALILTFLKTNVFAMTVSSVDTGNNVYSVSSSTSWYVNKSFDNVWYNWGPGYVYFNFGISKQTTDSVSPLVSPRSVIISSSNADFICSFGSNNSNNSTYVSQTYSVVCPVNFANSGMTLMTINLMPLSNTPISTYQIYFDGHMTFVNDSISFDSSGIVNSQNQNTIAQNNNRDQNFGNLITDNRANTQAIIDSQEETSNAVNDLNDTINNDDVSDSESQASSFFGNFQNNDHGLSGIITAPLSFIQSLSSSSCSPLTWQFGWFENQFSLPCATTIVQNNWPDFLTLYQTITFGIVAYVVVLKIFALIKGFKDPDSDKLEVLEL